MESILQMYLQYHLIEILSRKFCLSLCIYVLYSNVINTIHQYGLREIENSCRNSESEPGGQ